MPQGNTARRIRVEDDLWDRFGDAIKAVDPESDRSKMLRHLIRWFVGDTTEPPRRPDPASSHDGHDASQQ